METIIVFDMPSASTTSGRQNRSTKIVLAALEELDHPSALEIFHWIRRAHPDEKIGVTSVYRAIKSLLDRHTIKPLNFHEGECRYELNDVGAEHRHLICTSCRKVQVVDAPIPPEVPLDLRFQVQFSNFDVFGLCFECEPSVRVNHN